MKYFTIMNNDTEESYYTYFSLSSETPIHAAMSEHIDLRYSDYKVETYREFNKNWHRYDLDVDEEETDDDEYFWD